jgi:hypothetical protein
MASEMFQGSEIVEEFPIVFFLKLKWAKWNPHMRSSFLVFGSEALQFVHWLSKSFHFFLKTS